MINKNICRNIFRKITSQHIQNVCPWKISHFFFLYFYVVVFSLVLNFLFLGMFLFYSIMFFTKNCYFYEIFTQLLVATITIHIANQQRNIKHTLLYNMFSLFFFYSVFNVNVTYKEPLHKIHRRNLICMFFFCLMQCNIQFMFWIFDLDKARREENLGLETFRWELQN